MNTSPEERALRGNRRECIMNKRDPRRRGRYSGWPVTCRG